MSDSIQSDHSTPVKDSGRRVPWQPLAEYLDCKEDGPGDDPIENLNREIYRPVCLLTWLQRGLEKSILSKTREEATDAAAKLSGGQRQVHYALRDYERDIVVPATSGGYTDGEIDATIELIRSAHHAVTGALGWIGIALHQANRNPPRPPLRRWIPADRAEAARLLKLTDGDAAFGDEVNEWFLFRDVNGEIFAESDDAINKASNALSSMIRRSGRRRGWTHIPSTPIQEQTHRRVEADSAFKEGPYATGCFRVGPNEKTSMGNCQWKLIRALWDDAKGGPTEPVTAENVVIAVYGKRNVKENLSKLPGLIRDTNKTLNTKSFTEFVDTDMARGKDRKIWLVKKVP